MSEMTSGGKQSRSWRCEEFSGAPMQVHVVLAIVNTIVMLQSQPAERQDREIIERSRDIAS